VKRGKVAQASFCTSPAGTQLRAFLSAALPAGADLEQVFAFFERERMRVGELAALARSDCMVVYHLLRQDVGKA
jgi:hypothetical protein